MPDISILWSYVDTYLHADWQGSPRAATDPSGKVQWREHYDPYGKKLAGVTEKKGYTGHVYDPETANTYMLARYYDADVGRFLMTDPIGSKDDLNLYAYVKGNPIGNVDPTGTSCEATTGTNIRTCTVDTVREVVNGSVVERRATPQDQQTYSRVNRLISDVVNQAREQRKTATIDGIRDGKHEFKMTGERLAELGEGRQITISNIPANADKSMPARSMETQDNTTTIFPSALVGSDQGVKIAIGHEFMHGSPEEAAAFGSELSRLSEPGDQGGALNHQTPYNFGVKELLGIP